MAMQKGENQYTRLRDDLCQVITKIKSRRICHVGTWEINPQGASLLELKGLVQAAAAIGYDIRLRLDGTSKIKIEAVQRVYIESTQWRFQSFTV